MRFLCGRSESRVTGPGDRNSSALRENIRFKRRFHCKRLVFWNFLLMRRISVPLAFAALLVSLVVAYTYRARILRQRDVKAAPAPKVKIKYETVAPMGWSYGKDDPNTNQPVVRLRAASLEATKDPSTFALVDVKLRLYSKDGGKYTYVTSSRAFFDGKSKILRSDAPVTIVMNIPSDKNAEDPAQVADLVRIIATGVTYQTDDGKAWSSQPATFKFAHGGGSATGVSYDPSTGELDLKSAVILNMESKTPGGETMHVESGTLVYKEKEQKIYLSPWSKLQRGGTSINGGNAVVTLVDQVVHQVDAEHADGTDIREDKQTAYSADQMTALFDDDGNMTKLLAAGNARVVSTSATSRTTLTAKQAGLDFVVHPSSPGGAPESDLDQVRAQGNAVAQSDPLPPPGQPAPDADSHTLRCERIIMRMKPGGKEVQEIEAPQTAQLDFKPNRADHPVRSLTASHLRIFYGDGSYIDRFLAWDVTTHTQKPVVDKAKPPAPSTTWSDTLTATFKPDSNQLAAIEQTGHFRYEQGARKASANKAFLDETANRITLVENARMSDDTGTTTAAKIILDQASGDMDASGHVSSARAPDKSQKQGTSVLDPNKVLEAHADNMLSREDNTQFTYSGHATLWQGANRLAADRIVIDTDDKTVVADGNVTSELVDSNQQKPGVMPLFTTITAPKLSYKDDVRRADYTGGVKMLRNGMTVTSKQMQAYLNPQSQTGDSSLNHAIAEGDVKVVENPQPGDTRTGTGQLCEFDTKENKVVLSGGDPQVDDTIRGEARGDRITYFSDDDKLIVDGDGKKLAYSLMHKKQQH